jgi:hypothetical protein
MQENLSVKGHVKAVLLDEKGNVKETYEFKNLVVAVGRAHITSRMLEATADVMGWMEVGTGNTAATASDTQLEAPVADSRIEVTSATQATTTTTNDSIVYECTFLPGVGTGALSEAGIFNAGTEGVMLCRTVFGVITKGSGDTLILTWTVSLS